jgi:hypothetical protein
LVGEFPCEHTTRPDWDDGSGQGFGSRGEEAAFEERMGHARIKKRFREGIDIIYSIGQGLIESSDYFSG